MHVRELRQRDLFDAIPAEGGPELSREVQDEAVQVLAQWLYALSKAMTEESADDQDQH